MLDFVTQTPSRSKSQELGIRENLDHLDSLLGSNELRDASSRIEIKQRAESIRSHLETRTYPNRDELRQYVRSLEVLRDAGSETREELVLRKSQAWVRGITR